MRTEEATLTNQKTKKVTEEKGVGVVDMELCVIIILEWRVYRNMVTECESSGINFKLILEFPDQSFSITGPMHDHAAKIYLAHQAPIFDLPPFLSTIVTSNSGIQMSHRINQI